MVPGETSICIFRAVSRVKRWIYLSWKFNMADDAGGITYPVSANDITKSMEALTK